MPKIKYKTEEEKIEAYHRNAKNFYEKHKNDPKFIEKRKAYLNGYYKSLDKTRKEAYREYQADYAFYVRSVVSGRFEKKIAKSKKQLKALQDKIYNMEQRLLYIKNKFAHLKK